MGKLDENERQTIMVRVQVITCGGTNLGIGVGGGTGVGIGTLWYGFGGYRYR